MSDSKVLIKGAEFIIKETPDVYIPEDITEEQRMFINMSREFVEKEVQPVLDRLEKLEPGLSESLMEKMGELGLLSSHIPEDYGGMALDVNTNSLLGDTQGAMGSFNTTFAAHTGIGMLPILYYGTDMLKSKYLPELGRGKLKAAYCLTEPTSGSDALAAKTTAMLSEDGTHYVLNGQKMWITNAGFADVFIVFAQVGGDQFTGFVVDANLPGITLGEEEDKLGIKGSSTRQVYFEQVKVPVDHILGEIGKGHLIAFNALNIGRFKLGLLCVGAMKSVIGFSVDYAKEREQFGTAIANFGAIQYKLAEMVIRNLAVESAVYRTSGLMNEFAEQQHEAGVSYGEAKRAAAEEYAIECSIVKVAGSEMADYVVDENLQIHGGLGFSEEYSAARMYRDNRITRIYEGTNEINRMLIIDMIFKRALKGRLDITTPAWDVQKELKSMPKFEDMSAPFAAEMKAVKDFKKVFLMVAGAAAKEQMEGKLNLKNEQMLLTFISDIVIDMFHCESFLLRVQKMEEKGEANAAIFKEAMQVYIHDANARIAKNALDAVSSFTSGDLHKIFSMGIKRFTAYPAQNVIAARRKLAKVIIDHGAYPFYI